MTKRRLCINALGEVFFRGPALTVLDLQPDLQILLADLKVSPRRAKQYREASWEFGNKRPKWMRRIDAAVDKETLKIAAKSLTKAELKVLATVYKLQPRLNTDRFRVYANVVNDVPHIRLVTEFIYFVDDKEARAVIYGAAKKLGWKVDTINQDKHLNRVGCRNGQLPTGEGYRKAGRSTKDGIQWFVGPNHGRMERQVELGIEIPPGIGVMEARRLVSRCKKETNAFWTKYGVSVI